MRKHKILLIICVSLFLTGTLEGQEFGTPDTRWIFDYNGAWSKGVTDVSYEKDTILNNRLIRKFKKVGHRTEDAQVWYQIELDPIFFRVDAGIVEYSEDLEFFDTLFNFQASIGEEWLIPKRNSFTGDTSFYSILTVLDTFSTEISGINVLSQSVEYKYPYNNGTDWRSFVDTVFEDIGLKYYYILPFDFAAVSVDGGEGGAIRCFKNDRLGLVELDNSELGEWEVHSVIEYDCDLLTKIKEPLDEDENMLVYPNPVDEVLFINSAYSKIKQIELINIEGEIILFKKFNNHDVELSLNSLPSGIYFVVVNGVIKEKIVKK